MLVSVGAKSLRGHQVRGHQVQVHGCEKKFGQKSDVSLVLGSSARHGRGWVGRLQSVALIGNHGRKHNILLRPGWDNTASSLLENVIEILIFLKSFENKHQLLKL